MVCSFYSSNCIFRNKESCSFTQALRISMEEQRRVQEAEIGRSTTAEGGQQNPPANTGTASEIDSFVIVILSILSNIFNRH